MCFIPREKKKNSNRPILFQGNYTEIIQPTHFYTSISQKVKRSETSSSGNKAARAKPVWHHKGLGPCWCLPRVGDHTPVTTPSSHIPNEWEQQSERTFAIFAQQGKTQQVWQGGRKHSATSIVPTDLFLDDQAPPPLTGPGGNSVGPENRYRRNWQNNWHCGQVRGPSERKSVAPAKLGGRHKHKVHRNQLGQQQQFGAVMTSRAPFFSPSRAPPLCSQLNVNMFWQSHLWTGSLFGGLPWLSLFATSCQ